MPKNNIRVERTRLGISQGALAEAMPDGVEAVALGFIENGRVLPTKAGMKVLCEMFNCRPDDLYDRNELNLTGDEPQELEGRTTRERVRHEEGMQQFRVWLRDNEKAALERAISELNYRSSAEWMREMYRNTIARAKRLKLKDEPKP